LNSSEEKALEREMERHYDRIERLADARLDRLRRWFRNSFSGRHRLFILFENGNNSIQVDGRTLHMEDIHANLSPVRFPLRYGRAAPCLDEVCNAIRDVWRITDGYRRVWPNNVWVRGGKQVLRSFVGSCELRGQIGQLPVESNNRELGWAGHSANCPAPRKAPRKR
jgi:hypothetical protein